jgi:hypothetical protein
LSTQNQITVIEEAIKTLLTMSATASFDFIHKSDRFKMIFGSFRTRCPCDLPPLFRTTTSYNSHKTYNKPTDIFQEVVGVLFQIPRQTSKVLFDSMLYNSNGLREKAAERQELTKGPISLKSSKYFKDLHRLPL